MRDTLTVQYGAKILERESVEIFGIFIIESRYLAIRGTRNTILTHGDRLQEF